MKVSIIGSGYVGLVTGACLADRGHRVVCVDIDPAKVDAINRAEPPIHEEGLPELLRRNAGKSLTASNDLDSAVRDSDLTMIAVGTPFDGKTIDLTYIRKTAEQIGGAIRAKHGYHVVVVKSTVVPGTTDDVVGPLVARASGKTAGEGFGLGMNPEFLSEGEAIRDFSEPDRIVLGGRDERTLDTMAKLYEGFDGVPVLRTNNRTAELIKYASNSLQATAISFANEIASLCSAVGGVDVVDVLHGVHLMKELSMHTPEGPRKAGLTSFLGAGCGFGGSCFPKDVKALVAHGQASGVPMRLLQSVLDINRDQPSRMIDMLRKRAPDLQGLRVAVLGLAFKPGTDDMRESPSIPVVEQLLEAGAKVKAYDPIAGQEARRVFDGKPLDIVGSLAACLEDVDAVLLVTRWPEFAAVPGMLRSRTSPPVLIDGRRMIPPDAVPRYEGIGR
ncbi:MAG TPA: UDP-glucose/GDP-mannose dehydrogenase family protein [Candidatus Eisenbacteria bacterium]|nr:UDP-glucose/GDP-mannose dehydrogenase family protein [Candidatus Eisenbacteria bacterium]